jgi:quercetin dioxygenase-like cupin family protein
MNAWRMPVALGSRHVPPTEVSMALKHAESGDVISVMPLGERLAASRSETLIKSDALEVNRLVLRAGSNLREHRVPGEITVQCIEGEIEFTARGAVRVLRPGDLIYLAGGEPHALHARADSSLLLTILLGHGAVAERL